MSEKLFDSYGSFQRISLLYYRDLVWLGLVVNLLVFFARLFFTFFDSSLLSQMSGVVEPVSDFEARRKSGEVDVEDWALLLNIDASQFDDLVFEILGSLRNVELVTSLIFVDEVQHLFLEVSFSAKKNEVASLHLIFVLVSSPPGDELERVLKEIGVVPLSEIEKSSELALVKLSVLVFLQRFETSWNEFLGVWLSVVNQPVWELVHDSHKFSRVGYFELESSESDDVSHVIDLGTGFRGFRVNADGCVFVELKLCVVLLLSLVMEGGVDDFKSCGEVVSVVGFGWLWDVYDDSPTQRGGVLLCLQCECR